MRRLTVITSLLLLLASCGDDDAAGVGTVEYQAYRAQPTACGAEPPPPVVPMTFPEPDDLGIAGAVTAILHTSCGDITIELLPETAPVTVNSFVFLAEAGYFDGTVSHRIAAGFVVQLGDPDATGRGFPGYRIPDELPEPGFSYTTGVVAMANGGPGTGGSQFFIALADISLAANYTVFGRVVSGDDVLQRIAAIPVTTNPLTGERSVPLETLYIDAVTIGR